MAKKGKEVVKLANKIKRWLKPYCKKIKIAGSIRRNEKNPKDIDIVLVSKKDNKKKIKERLKEEGKYLRGGKSQMFFKINNVKVQLFFAKEDEWGAMLMAYSGKKGSNIGLRLVAKKKGFKLTRHGLFKRKSNKKIAGKTEKEIYKALNRPYKEPEDR